MSDEERLSKLLWDARENLEMFADVVGIRMGNAEYLTKLVAEIDAYRTEQGWSPHGFGREGRTPEEQVT